MIIIEMLLTRQHRTFKTAFAVFTILFIETAIAQDFSPRWSNGYKVESADKNFKMKFGGRIMFDAAFFFQEDTVAKTFGNLNNGVEFRRARFFNSGQIYNNVKYQLQLEFAGGDIAFKDVFIEFTKLPGVGNFRVGHFKEPFRLDVMTSSKYMQFMERSFHVDFFADRNSGFLFYNSYNDQRFAWQAGIFRRGDGAGNDPTADDGYNITGRITALPVLNKEKKQRLHLGVAYSYRKPESRSFEISPKPEAHLGTEYIGTDSIGNVDNVILLGTELALDIGSFAIQAEYIQATVTDRFSTSLPALPTYYVQLSYFLTGETRHYKSSYTGMGRPKIKKNFGQKGGSGAWEVALRYSSVDFDNEILTGGSQSDITIGLNWSPNPATRVMANYILATLNNLGTVGIFQMRFMMDF